MQYDLHPPDPYWQSVRRRRQVIIHCQSRERLCRHCRKERWRDTLYYAFIANYCCQKGWALTAWSPKFIAGEILKLLRENAEVVQKKIFPPWPFGSSVKLALTINERNSLCVFVFKAWGGFIPLETTDIWFLSKCSKCQDLSKWYPITLLALTSKPGWKNRAPAQRLFLVLLKGKKSQEQYKQTVQLSWIHF